MAKSTTATCCITLPLKLEKWQSDRLEKRFELARQIYNTLLRFELNKLNRLKQNATYASVMDEIHRLLDEGKGGSAEVKALYKTRNDMLREAGFSEYGFKTDIKDFYKHFNENIGSHVAVHGIAVQVWTAFDKLFFGSGKAVHFKKRGDIRSLKGGSVSGKSGGSEIMFKGNYVEWKGLRLPIKLDPQNDYENEMLSKRIKYCRIINRPGRYKPHWYVQLSLEGFPAVKHNADGSCRHPLGVGNVGIDIGPQTIAYSANGEAELRVLADRVENIERQQALLQRKMDRSRRATNPDNFMPDGTIKKGVRLNWVKSGRYLRYQNELRYLQQRQALIRKQQHNELANHLLTLGDRFFVEDMNWTSLTHRAKKTEISEKTGRYKRKKRFGKSVANRAPAELVSMISLKLVSRRCAPLNKVPTGVRASQYNHITGEYRKKPMGQRWNDMPDGHRIQRDLYSAFLLQHTLPDLSGFDDAALHDDYANFVILHDAVIQELPSRSKVLSSMGIRRSAS